MDMPRIRLGPTNLDRSLTADKAPSTNQTSHAQVADEAQDSFTRTGPKATGTATSGAARPRIEPSQVKTSDDLVRFVGDLETKYPNAHPRDMMRALRQHYYSDDGNKNQFPLFDMMIGRKGGKFAPELKGIDKDLQGLPMHVKNKAGDRVDISHIFAGADAFYDGGLAGQVKGRTVGALASWGGDFLQTGAELVFAPFSKKYSFDEAIAKSSKDQLRGDAIGYFNIGGQVGSGLRVSVALWSAFE